MSELASPIRDHCLVLKEMVGRIADLYRLKQGGDQENP